MEYYIVPLFTISLGLLPISVFSIMVYAVFGTLPGLYYLIIFLIFSAPVHISIIKYTNVSKFMMNKFEKSFNDFANKLKNLNPNIYFFFSIGPLFPYVVVLLYVCSLQKNIFLSSVYLLTSTLPGIILVFSITHGLLSDELSLPIRLSFVSLGLLLFLYTRKK